MRWTYDNNLIEVDGEENPLWERIVSVTVGVHSGRRSQDQ